jgi:hypothetical protein
MGSVPSRAWRNWATNRDHPPLCPDWRLWALSGIVALIDVAWLPFSRLTIAWSTFQLPVLVGTICIAWYCAGYFIRLRDGPRVFALGLAFTGLTGPCLFVLGDLVMTLPTAMADSLLADWDRAMGFDWMSYLSWVTARPWLSQALLWIYYAIAPASLLAFFVLHFLGQRQRASEYLALSFVSGIIGTITGAAFPALGAVTYFQAPHALMAGFPAHTGAQWVQRLTELRSGLPVEINQLTGLISFPSYHVALTMIIAWCLRGVRFAVPICTVYVIGTAASAPIIGGHYFVDLIAGAALVFITIAAAKVAGRLPLLRSRAPFPASAE